MKGWLAAALFAAPGSAQACALALIMALDVSSSVNSAEYAIQKDGLATALRDAEVKEAILASPNPVYLAAYEWSGEGEQGMIADWAPMPSPAAIDAFAARLEAHDRRSAAGSTALGDGLLYGLSRLAPMRLICERLVIDVSGDGVNNAGPSPEGLHARGVFAGVTINGLVIRGNAPDPERYYRERVIHGEDAFVMVAHNGFEDYPDLIKGKLLRELRPPIFLGALQ